jgi:pimeloyl-ACP methyl ester carboxylesterase
VRTITTPDGRALTLYEGGDPSGFPVLMHHGTPMSGLPYDRHQELAREQGIRLIGYDRPGYGGSDRHPGRSVADAAADVAAILDALGVERFATWGASGGGPHALACAALLPDRVIGAVTFASPAPFTEAFDWYAGMVAPGGLEAAEHGRDARERYAATEVFDETSFTATDWAALRGTWAPLGRDAGRAGAAGPDGAIDDDVALVNPWGFEVTNISVPVLLVQGGEDRVIPPSHAEFLHRAVPASELWMHSGDGHISVLDACPDAMDWLIRLTGRAEVRPLAPG